MKTYLRRQVARKIVQRLAVFYPSFSETQLKNPFFIIGCEGSATSWLLKMLAVHPDIAAYPDKTDCLWHPQAYPWQESKLLIPPFWSDPHTFIQASLRYRTQKDNSKIKAVFAGYQTIAGGKCFLNRSATISFMLPEVLKLFPRARFIHLVRDGRAVALSSAKKQLKKQQDFADIYKARGYYLEFEALLESFAHLWQQHIFQIEQYKSARKLEGDTADATLRDRQLLEIHYEDILDNPVTSFSRIAEFMEIDTAIFCAQDYSTIKTKTYNYRDELQTEVVQVIEQLIEAGLQIKNYWQK